jgi:hypothetical protein
MLHQKPLQSEKVTVWCHVSAFAVLGPYLFETATGQSVTLTSDRYVELLREFLNDKLCWLRVDTRLVWFQQDGATAHTARNSMAVVRGVFLQHVISRFWRHWMASMLTWFIRMRLFSVGLFEGEGLCSPTSHYTGIEGLHLRGNSSNSSKYAEESHGQCKTTCRDVPYLQWWVILSSKSDWKCNDFPCCLPLFSWLLFNFQLKCSFSSY